MVDAIVGGREGQKVEGAVLRIVTLIERKAIMVKPEEG
jgi:hypothetical protein